MEVLGTMVIDLDKEEVVPSFPPLVVLQMRFIRQYRSPDRYSPTNFYLLLTDGREPKNFAEALESEQVYKWMRAIDNEIDLLRSNSTWELIQ